MLVHNYELLKMKQDESIASMFTSFIDIINGFKSLGKSCTNSELVRKNLKSFPRMWEVKITTIQEAKDLNELPLKELLGTLMIHEPTKKSNEVEDFKKKRVITLKSFVETPYRRLSLLLKFMKDVCLAK